MNTVHVETKPTKTECLEQYNSLTNKDKLSSDCKEIMDMLHASEAGVSENHSINVRGGRRERNGVSHAVLQRRMTGKWTGSGVSA